MIDADIANAADLFGGVKVAGGGMPQSSVFSNR